LIDSNFIFKDKIAWYYWNLQVFGVGTDSSWL